MKTTTIILTILLSVSLFSCNSGTKTDTYQETTQTDEQIASNPEGTGWGDIGEGEDIPSYNFVVRGLGDYNSDSLKSIVTYIEKFYGYNCQIMPPVSTTSDMYLPQTSNLDAARTITILKNNNVKTLYVTSENLVDGKLDLRGGTYINADVVIVELNEYNKKTVLHEIGHTLGLEHCDNKRCLMSIYNDDHVVKDFCDKCKKTLKENGEFQ